MKINLLDDSTIDKIAAGEVVERPFSVVKELVENSIDSGADAISVEIKDGGKTLIRVTDNGSGIEKEDITTAFLRHATSKITSSDDLMSIHSLGFRGEALASIAAVSKVELITKTPDDITGTKYVSFGGKEVSFDEIGAPNGSTFFIRDLFFNTPARKKFLKSEKSEGSLIQGLIEHLSLSKPHISFKLISDGKEKVSTFGSGQLKNTILEVFGRQTASNVLDVEYEGEDMSIRGYIGKSILSRANRGYEIFFINGRFIKSDILSKALEQAYSGYLMGHQFPFGVLELIFPDGRVDVNVHPTKTKVRFDNPDEISDRLYDVVRNRLSKREDIEESYVGDLSVIQEAKEEEEKCITKNPEPFEIIEIEENRIKKAEEYEAEAYEVKPLRENVERIKTYEQQVFLSKEARAVHKVLGQVFGTYWLIEYDGKLFILDQHAAHEKILYERTMEAIKNKKITSQQISPPIVVTLLSSERETMEECMEAIESMGFEIEPFGQNEVAITCIPADFSNIDAKEVLLSILSQKPKKTESLELIVERVASLSCKAAVKGNHDMSHEEVGALIDELMELENPYHCPHGRPTMISFSRYELDKKFKRII